MGLPGKSGYIVRVTVERAEPATTVHIYATKKDWTIHKDSAFMFPTSASARRRAEKAAQANKANEAFDKAQGVTHTIALIPVGPRVNK